MTGRRIQNRLLAVLIPGVEDRGVIASGKRAGLVAGPGHPLDDIRVMEDVRFVMKHGTICRQE